MKQKQAGRFAEHLCSWLASGSLRDVLNVNYFTNLATTNRRAYLLTALWPKCEAGSPNANFSAVQTAVDLSQMRTFLHFWM